jgi:large subunit ribosomal protein L1
MISKADVQKAIDEALKEKGKRKFKQSVEAVFNFRNYDVTKPENRINIDVSLPKGKGRSQELCVFADGQIALDAKNAGVIEIYDAAGIVKLAQNKKKLKEMAKSYEFLASPNMMMQVGKNLGQVLGGKGRLPKPIAGNTAEAVKLAKSRVRVVSKGKYLPTVQCAIGSEDMSAQDLSENFEAVLEKVKAKVGEPCLSNCYVKLTMGPAIKVGGKLS